MIFGRKGRKVSDDAVADASGAEFDDTEVVDADEADDADEFDDADEMDDADELDDDGTGAGDAAEVDPRADGPFDHDEVDLSADDVARDAYGPLIVTTFDGLDIMPHVDPASGTVLAILAIYEGSGLELALFAAPTSGGLAQELREDTVEEAVQGGGSAEVADGPFGPEVRRVMPMEGPEGEQLFLVSRIWVVEGPRWLLRGTLVGPAAMTEGETPPSDVFVEFFRNVVVRRDDSPRVPGELITLAPAEAAKG